MSLQCVPSAWVIRVERSGQMLLSIRQASHRSAGVMGRAGLHVEAAASGSGTHFGVGNVAQLHAHHPEPKGGVLVGHQLQRSNAVQLMQLLRHIK